MKPAIVVGLLSTIVMVGCSSSTSAPSAPQSKTLEVYSWLTSGSEKSALDSLFSVMRSEESSVAIINAAQDRSEIAQKELPERLAKGNPPDAFQVVSGTGLYEWVDKGALEP